MFAHEIDARDVQHCEDLTSLFRPKRSSEIAFPSTSGISCFKYGLCADFVDEDSMIRLLEHCSSPLDIARLATCETRAKPPTDTAAMAKPLSP